LLDLVQIVLNIIEWNWLWSVEKYRGWVKLIFDLWNIGSEYIILYNWLLMIHSNLIWYWLWLR